MKKIRKVLQMLVATILLLVPAVHAEAADKNYVEVKSGSTSAKLTFTVENALALEGTISTGEKTGFKPVSIQLAGTADGSMIKYSPEGDQFVVIGNNIPADIKITVNLESGSPMKDGQYKVTLKYGKTTTSGSYSAGEMKAVIYVGQKHKDTEDEDESSKATNTDRTTTSMNTPKTETTESVTTVGSDRADMIGMVDYSELKSALQEAESLKGGNMSKNQLERLLTAIEDGNNALESTSQTEVDAAASKLNDIIMELRGTGAAVAKPLKKSGDGLPFGKIWPILLAILLMVILVIVIWYLLKKKRQEDEDYDGAPLVDYDISDDDE